METQLTIPTNESTERAVIGYLINNSNELVIAMEILTLDDFSNNNYKEIYKAMLELSDKNQSIDLITISSYFMDRKLLRTEDSAAYYITQISSQTSSIELSNYCRILNEYRMRRDFITVGSSLINSSSDYTSDVFDIYNSSLDSVYNLMDNISSESSTSTIKQAVLETIQKIDNINKSGSLLGISSGFKDIDNYTCGWMDSDLIILAARPSMGKTSLALSFAINSAIAGKKVYLCSLEMNKQQLTQRMLSIYTDLPLQNIRNGELKPSDYEILLSQGGLLSELPIIIDDSADITINILRSKIKREKAKNGLDIVIIDYLQLITQDAKSREQEVSKISRGLKLIAKEMDIPVIALAQLSRKVEERSDKKPMLSDLRDSGSIEQDADLVTFIWRPEYYGILESADGSDLTGKAKFMIAKNRNGRVDNDNINLYFDCMKTKFTNEKNELTEIIPF